MKMKSYVKIGFLLMGLIIMGCGSESTPSGQRQMGGATQGVSLSLERVVSTFAGGAQGSGDGVGSNAQFYGPSGITTDGINLYVSDATNHTIRKISIATGFVSTLAGTVRTAGALDCTIGTSASFSLPLGITTDGTDLYVADTGNHIIRKIGISTGSVTTIAGIAGNFGATDCTIGTGATFDNPYGITTDGENLYVADTHNNSIRKINIITKAVTTLAGGHLGSSDNTGTLASFNGPVGITTDGIYIYVADAYNNTIRKIVIATGVVTTLAGTAGNPGTLDNTGVSASFSIPFGITTDGSRLYVTGSGGTIRKIEIVSGVVTTIAGTPYTPGFTNDIGATASFRNPLGITTDGKSIYLADDGNNAIRKIR